MTRELSAAACVIGAGPAGSILAEALRRAGVDVLLVERGPRYDLASRRSTLQHRLWLDGPAELNDEIPTHRRPRVETGPSDPLPYATRLQVGVGGGSLVWAAQCPRPRPEDLAPDDGWPLAYAELEPHLLAAERALGVAGDNRHPYVEPRSGPYPMSAHAMTVADRDLFAPAARRLGWTWHAAPVAIASRDYEGRVACRRCMQCDACPSGARYSADLVHVPRFEAAGGRVVARCSVRRLEVDPTGRRVVAAHAVAEDGEVVLRAERFIVATGGIESQRLLLLSKDDRHHPDGLGNAGGALGRGMTDHYFAPATIVASRRALPERGFPAGACHHHRVNGEHKFHFIGQPGAWWLDPIHEELLASGAFDPDEAAARTSRTLGLAYTIEARSRGTLTLSPTERDANGDPLARVSIPVTGADREAHRAVSESFLRFADAMSARQAYVGLSGHHFWWAAHTMGGARMAASPRHGACDINLKIFELDNAYVLSGAVLPGRGTANPTLAIAALALRLAAHLVGGS
ncbi:MAG: GMC family oxidoreductase [Sandaracinaceae bacterium]|nr:GMC family oxidoreductase [Sandaracinaceae bacterium]